MRDANERVSIWCRTRLYGRKALPLTLDSPQSEAENLCMSASPLSNERQDKKTVMTDFELKRQSVERVIKIMGISASVGVAVGSIMTQLNFQAHPNVPIDWAVKSGIGMGAIASLGTAFLLIINEARFYTKRLHGTLENALEEMQQGLQELKEIAKQAADEENQDHSEIKN